MRQISVFQEIEMRVGYVVKRYPRYSETFVVNEILAHESAGMAIEIFSMRPPVDSHFQDVLARVKAGVTYIPAGKISADTLWKTLSEAATTGGINDEQLLAFGNGADARDVHQAVLLARSVTDRKIDHLHAHFASVSTTVTRMAAHIAGIPYSFTAHAKDIFHEAVDPDDLCRKLRDAAAVITVSDFNVAYLQQLCGESAGKVQRVYNGLDLATFSYAEDTGRPRHIVAVGRLVEKKGFDVLIDACELLARNGQAATCEIIGGGELHGVLSAQIERAGLGALVTLTGPLPQDEVKRRLVAARVFAAPCVVGRDGNRDGLPTVLLEAMALGVACVSTDVTGIPEMIDPGESGLIVPPGDPAMLAISLKRVLGDERLQRTFARNARRKVEQSFDIHRNAANIRDIFFDVRPESNSLKHELAGIAT